MPTIYRKTAKGQAEIATREYRLSPRLRSALILVDGQRSESELSRMIAGDPAAVLQQLLNEGFIDVFAVLADKPPRAADAVPPAAAPAPAPRGPSSAERLASFKREAVRFLTDKLGPAAESLSLRIERCKDRAEMAPLITQGAGLLRNFGHGAAAKAFVERFGDDATTR